ncbi:TIGR03085 family metal-binding protein [Lapillicoccus sp.]|uniref:TIGR03085 family metal-binding protein n=1 Tax=Lapillicoccus sp. TaxID=1909287 RepID=UPI003264E36F
MTSYAQQERHAICDSFVRLGPDAPTIDDPWLARDLAAHLAIRDSRPDLALGMFVPPLKGRLDAAMHALASGDWPTLVDRVRTGPPKWSPTRVGRVDEAVNGMEFFIHHEDLLRGAPGFERRALDVGLERSLWDSLKRGGKLMFRKVPSGVVLVAEGHGRAAVSKPGESGTVILRGTPGELMLFASGRGRVAEVELDGPGDAVAELEAAHLGMG